MINKEFISKNIEKLINFRNVEEISNYAKSKDITLSIDEIYKLKDSINRGISLINNDKSVLSLNILEQVAGGDMNKRDWGNVVSITGSVAAAACLLIPGAGIGLGFAINTATSYGSQALKSSYNQDIQKESLGKQAAANFANNNLCG